MTIEELLALSPDASITVHNRLFVLQGTVTVALDTDGEHVWLIADDGRLLSVKPATEEILSFNVVEEELEPEGSVVSYRGRAFEFNLEDAGTVRRAVGDVEHAEEDRYAFRDFEDDEGERVRILTNETTGDVHAFHGTVVEAEDVQAA